MTHAPGDRERRATVGHYLRRDCSPISLALGIGASSATWVRSRHHRLLVEPFFHLPSSQSVVSLSCFLPLTEFSIR